MPLDLTTNEPMWKSYANLPRPVHILCVGTFVNRVGTLLVPFLTIYVTKELGLGNTFATIAMGAFGLGAIGAAVIGGHLADRIGRRPLLLSSLFGGAAILVVYPFLTEPWMILAAVALFGLVAEMYRPAAGAMMTDLCEPDQRTYAFGLMYFSINLGFAFGPLIGGQLAEYSFKWLFWFDALTAAAYGCVILFAIRETLPKQRTDTRRDSTVDASTDAPSTADHDGTNVSISAALLHMARDRAFAPFCLATFLVAMVYMQAISTFPLYLGQLGMSAKTYGRIIALNGMMIVLLQLPMTSLIGRYHRGTMLVVASLIVAAGYGLKGAALLPWHFAFCVGVWTLGEITAAPLTQSVAADLAPVHLRARYMGALGMCFSGSLLIGAPLGGFVLNRFGGPTLWTACCVVAILAACLQFAVRRKLGKRTSMTMAG